MQETPFEFATDFVKMSLLATPSIFQDMGKGKGVQQKKPSTLGWMAAQAVR
jgi:hypothetical protein